MVNCWVTTPPAGDAVAVIEAGLDVSVDAPLEPPLTMKFTNTEAPNEPKKLTLAWYCPVPRLAGLADTETLNGVRPLPGVAVNHCTELPMYSTTTFSDTGVPVNEAEMNCELVGAPPTFALKVKVDGLTKRSF